MRFMGPGDERGQNMGSTLTNRVRLKRESEERDSETRHLGERNVSVHAVSVDNDAIGLRPGCLGW